MTDLDELERLLREATAGPWWVYVHTGNGTTIEPGDDWTVYGNGREPVVHEGGFTVHAAANAALIAALRNCAEELIRDARRYRWLRDDSWGATGAAPAVCMVDSHGRPCVDDERAADPILEGRELDANIDAAIAQEGKG